MRTLLPVVLVTVLAAAGPAVAQTAEGSQSQGTQQGDVVQNGAGTKGDVTPGSSGPQPDGTGETIQPLPVMFPIKPPADPFYGPGMLPIAPGPMRCEIIGPAAPRQRCEATAQRRNPG
ncbi:hypothetical protein [Microvirga sp. M2]|uniref:hypothetical protein n=1 Tax=Microvirga sp. M2 TaxID=3073270 RepID=UPI0039C151A4